MGNYRIGKYQCNKCRSVLIKFADIEHHDSCFKNKRQSTGITIKEDLAKKRLFIMKLVNDKFGFRNVCSKFGLIWSQI